MGHIAPVNSVDFASGNSDYLVTSGRDRAVKIWHWRSKTVKLNIDLRKYGRGTGLLLFNYYVYEICIKSVAVRIWRTIVPRTKLLLVIPSPITIITFHKEIHPNYYISKYFYNWVNLN